MSQNELISKIENLKALEQLIKEAEQEAEDIRDSIKAEMLEQGIEELTVPRHNKCSRQILLEHRETV